MTKTQIFVREIRQKRREISRLQEDLTDMLDHLAVVEARAKNAGKPTRSLEEARAKFGLLAANPSRATS
jgi:hypothetical protein